MKSAIGIGALLMDGLGDTIRVSLTEDPEYEMDPCQRLADLGHKAASEVRKACATLENILFTSALYIHASYIVGGLMILTCFCLSRTGEWSLLKKLPAISTRMRSERATFLSRR